MSESSVLKGRTVCLDTETTGISPVTGRMFEIALVELIDGEVTGNVFHEIIDPEMEVDRGAQDVHGWDWESIKNELKNGEKYPKYREVYRQLKTTQKFEHIADRVRKFVGDAVVHAHNAQFDRDFLDMEFKRIGQAPLSDTNKFHCTLKSASVIRPRRKNTLDVLAAWKGLKTDSYAGLSGNKHVSEKFQGVCQELGIDPTDRDEHAALKDTMILAHVVRTMMTPENELMLQGTKNETDEISIDRVVRRSVNLGARLPVAEGVSSEDMERHRKLMDRIQKSSGKEMSLEF